MERIENKLWGPCVYFLGPPKCFLSKIGRKLGEDAFFLDWQKCPYTSTHGASSSWLFSFFFFLWPRRDVIFFWHFFLINLGDCYFFFLGVIYSNSFFLSLYFFTLNQTKMRKRRGIKIFSILPLFHSLTIFYPLIFPPFQPNKL